MSLMFSIPTDTCTSSLVSNPLLGTETRTYANEIGCDTRLELLLLTELLVGRRRGVDDKRLCVTHVGEVARQLERVDDLAANGRVALDAKREHAAVHILAEDLLRQLVRRVARQTGVAHPGNLLVFLKPLRERERVLAVTLDAERERLETLQEEEGGEGVHGRAEVAEDLNAGLDDESELAEGLAVLEAVVALRWLGEAGELAVRPVELA